jgi:cytochrome c oxidase cbb3-type subunit 1
MALPAVAIALCVLQTLRGAKTKCSGGPFCYMRFGVSSLVLSLLLAAGTGVSQISRVTNFTWFGTAQVQLQLYGFFAMTLSGAALYILPRISGLGLSSRLTRMQFWCMMPGSVLLTLPLFIGGVVQGVKLLNPETGIVDVAKSSMMFLRISTVGELLILFGAFLFLLNVTTLLVRYYRAVCFTAYSAVTAELEPTPAPSLKGNAEVRP